MREVIVYIDGFNLYHAIDDLKKPHLKWLDVVALGQSLLRPKEVLKEVKYFSAYATWMPDRFSRHRAYVDAIKANGASVHMAKFKEKPRTCRSCGTTWIGHEEKETDVQIAVHMVADAFNGAADRLIAITADTDLGPAIRMIAQNVPNKEVFVAAPPKRKKKCHSLGPKLEISPNRIAGCLLPEVVTMANGATVIRPPSYNPPPVS